MITKEEFERVLINAQEAGARAVSGMVDSFPCGGAYHQADGHSEIVKAFKKYGVRKGNYYEIQGWSASKDFRGYSISNNKGGGYQNMYMHSASTTAESAMLGVNGLVTSVRTYID